MKFFQCYIEGSRDSWEAICVDFDISVTARSLSEAKAILESAVSSYVSDALKEQEPTRSQLLNRRSPLAVRLGWRLRLVMANLGSKRNGPDFEGRFALSCPA